MLLIGTQDNKGGAYNKGELRSRGSIVLGEASSIILITHMSQRSDPGSRYLLFDSTKGEKYGYEQRKPTFVENRIRQQKV